MLECVHPAPHTFACPHLCLPTDVRYVLPVAAAQQMPLLLLQAEARYRELTGMGLSVNLVLVGNKGKQYFARRPQYNIASE